MHSDVRHELRHDKYQSIVSLEVFAVEGYIITRIVCRRQGYGVAITQLVHTQRSLAEERPTTRHLFIHEASIHHVVCLHTSSLLERVVMIAQNHNALMQLTLYHKAQIRYTLNMMQWLPRFILPIYG
jgi:hypothetical protein